MKRPRVSPISVLDHLMPRAGPFDADHLHCDRRPCLHGDGHIFRRPRGVFISIREAGRVTRVLRRTGKSADG
jgi:hypothetical protein